MSATHDVVIVGGAAMGSSLAYHLLSDPAFRGRVLVIEKDPSYRLAASALSAASIRQQFSTAVNIRISLHGIAFMRDIGARLEVDGDRPDIALREGGYLFLATGAGAKVLAENHALQTSLGADIALLGPADLARRFPWLKTEGLAAGAFGVSGEGWFDGWGLMQAFRRKARALGADYVQGKVAAVDKSGAGAVEAVRLADGRRIACGALVNCAGASGREVAALAGVDIPVRARKRFVFTFAAKDRIANCPLLIDPSGVYVRPEGDGFICGASPAPAEDIDWRDDDPAVEDVDFGHFENRVWPTLAHRIPAFETIKPGRAWAGPYDVCELDDNAIVGASPVPGFYLCNGFSGHGLQQSPAIGRGLAELILHGRYRTLDLGDLGYERVLARRPLKERNVV
jgi:glycine/D-amino acid oxidase-like deaminating enzyme